MNEKYIRVELFMDFLDRNARDDLLTPADIGTALEMIPAEDVRPVVHAHWIRHNGKENYDECSNCHCAYNSCGWEAHGYFCPHCGAKMDEKVDDQTNTSLPAMRGKTE